MKIQVVTSMTIAELQQAFNACFPYLSLAFFTQPRTVYQVQPVQYRITDASMPLKRIEANPHNAEVEISGDMTVNDLEHFFEREFGLYVEVNRKDGNSWSDLSLAEQNANASRAKDFHTPVFSLLPSLDARTEWYLG